MKSYDGDGNILQESWTYDGQSHRDNDLPAVTKYDKNGNKYEEYWMKNGWVLRKNPPDQENSNTKIVKEIFKVFNQINNIR